MTFPLARGDISLLCRGRASVFIVSPPGIHISLGICVWGYTYHGDTHITVTPLWPLNKAEQFQYSLILSTIDVSSKCSPSCGTVNRRFHCKVFNILTSFLWSIKEYTKIDFLFWKFHWQFLTSTSQEVLHHHYAFSMVCLTNTFHVAVRLFSKWHKSRIRACHCRFRHILPSSMIYY